MQRIAPMASMPDMRQKDQVPITIPMTPSASQGPSRPMSVLSIHKSLPPLPDEQLRVTPEGRPSTIYSLDGNGTQSAVTMDAQAMFRQDGFRQSTVTLVQGAAPPHMHTFPIMGKHGDLTTNAVDFGQYNELGLTRSRELYDFPGQHESAPSPIPKRRSKFGLGNLLGRKSQVSESRSSITEVLFESAVISLFAVPSAAGSSSRNRYSWTSPLRRL